MINQIVNGQDCLKLLFWWKIAFGSVATSSVQFKLPKYWKKSQKFLIYLPLFHFLFKNNPFGCKLDSLELIWAIFEQFSPVRDCPGWGEETERSSEEKKIWKWKVEAARKPSKGIDIKIYPHLLIFQ